jgi:hypothetical protein
MTITTAPAPTTLLDIWDEPTVAQTVSAEAALAIYIHLVDTVGDDLGMGKFSNHSIANTLHEIDVTDKAKQKAAQILSYWESKFFMAKLSDDFTLTSWREKLLLMCSNRHDIMYKDYAQILVTLPRITSYEERTDAIADKYVSHFGSTQWNIVEDVAGLELSIIDKYRHDTKAYKSCVYWLVDNENKVYEISISKPRGDGTMCDLNSAASAFNALFAISGRVRLDCTTKCQPLNNVTHNKFMYKSLRNITSINPI